jgi:predicted O-linked N-acetylglucosamine transferase (SPINDLY family)
MNPQLKLMLQQAIQAFQGGNFVGAEQVLRDFMLIKPNDFDAKHLLAIIYASQGQHQIAIQYYKNALAIIPNNASALSNLGSSLSAVGRSQEALIAFKKSLEINPDDPDFWYNIANILCDLGAYEEALTHYEQAITLNPTYFQAYNNYGKALFDLNRHIEALICYDKALEIEQNFLECLVNKGEALKELKRYDEALACTKKVIGMNPAYAQVWSNVGNILKELKRFDEAIAHYDKALGLKPDYAEGWSNKGSALYELKRFDEAIAHFDKALGLKPDYAEGWSNKGSALYELKRFDEAIAHFDKALGLKPDIDWAYGYLLHFKMKICSWSGIENSINNISKRVMADEKVAHPFLLLALNDDAFLHKKSSEVYLQNRYPQDLALGPMTKFYKKEKIRIGYFSADFRNHPISLLTAELFELHDKSRFEIIAFSFCADDKSPIRLRLSQAFNQFIDVSDMSDLEIAKLSRNLQIDIAIDMGGYTADSRTGVFAYRAAPIQVSYLGYLGTMGAEYIDYILADKIIVPEDLQKFYTEKIAYLTSYQANDRKRTISNKAFTRQELGLPDKGFVFCCFNNNYKILPSIFDSWMRILKTVEDSVLFLYAENQWVEVNLKKEAEARGISGARLVFGKSIPTEEYLARYKTCDLFLDTFPYNAGATASDALWMGLPVLTLIGKSFASRIAASLLNAIGLPELIANTGEKYEELAIELATNPKKLAGIKLELTKNRSTFPLFNTPLFTKNLEDAYIKIYEQYRASL